MTAVPTLFNIPNPPSNVTPKRPPPKKREPSVPTVDDDREFLMSDDNNTEQKSSPTEKKIEWQRKLRAQRSKSWRLTKKVERSKQDQAPPDPGTSSNEECSEETMKNTLSKFLSPAAVEFVMSQVRVSKTCIKGRRWKNSDKSLALALYHASRKAYSLLQKLFQLPSPRTLCKAMQNVQIRPGVSENFLKLFRIKVEAMTPQERLCAVVFDEMALKSSLQYNPADDEVEGFEDYAPLGRTQKPANQALLFMVRGLAGKWKQPVSYSLSNGPVKAATLVQLLMHMIRNVISIGLTPKALICDQGTNNRAVFRILGITETTPFFLCDGHKMFAFYDPPHLLKSIRNNFKLHGFNLDGHQISWEHVVMFYKKDSSAPIRLAPKLTNGHVYLKPFSHLRVSLAAQVLSHSVAAGITCMVTWGVLPSDAIHTAHFIERFDQLFNCFNSRSPRAKATMRHAITASSCHMEFLNQSLVWLRELKCNNKTTTLPCIEGWKLTISSLKQLWNEVNSAHGFSFLLTDRLNQDCIENMFSIIRGKGGHRYNPDPCQFRSSLRQSMIDFVMVSSNRKNCKDDLDAFLFSLENVQSKGSNTAVKSKLKQDVPPSLQKFMATSATPSLTMAEDNIVAYIAGYVAGKLSSVVCSSCFELMVASETDPSPSSAHQFIQAKMYQECAHGGLKTPSSLLLSAMQAMETAFRAVADGVIHITGLRMLIIKRLVKENAVKKLVCHSDSNCDLQFCVASLFTNIRLHHHIRLRSRLIAAEKRGQKRSRKTATFGHQ